MKIKRSVEIFASSLLALSILTSCAQSPEKQDAKYCYELTQGDLSEEEVASILGADTSYISCAILNTNYVRMMVSKDKPIYLVPTDNYLDFSRFSVKKITNELNDIFTIINPNIKFVYQESLPQNKSNVIMFDIDDEMSSLGRTSFRQYEIDNNELYSTTILIRVNSKLWPKAAAKNIKYETLLAHEVGHALGLDHKNENTTALSAMINTGECGPNGYYTLNDMFLFASLYGGYSNEEEILYVKELLYNYHENIKANSYARENIQDFLLNK